MRKNTKIKNQPKGKKREREKTTTKERKKEERGKRREVLEYNFNYNPDTHITNSLNYD